MAHDAFGNYRADLSEDTDNYERSVCEPGVGGGAGQIKSYVSDPVLEGVVPDDQDLDAIAYAVNGDNPTYGWDKIAHTWIIT